MIFDKTRLEHIFEDFYRPRFWVFFFVNLLIKIFLLVLPIVILSIKLPEYIILSIGASLFGGGQDSSSFIGLVFVVLWLVAGIIYGFVAITPSITVSVRRMHDLSLSGFWLWLFYGPLGCFLAWLFMNIYGSDLCFLPQTIVDASHSYLFMYLCVAQVVLLILFCFKGTMGPNRFGDDAVEEYQAIPSEGS